MIKQEGSSNKPKKHIQKSDPASKSGVYNLIEQKK
jgi:hypothetical protein